MDTIELLLLITAAILFAIMVVYAARIKNKREKDFQTDVPNPGLSSMLVTEDEGVEFKDDKAIETKEVADKPVEIQMEENKRCYLEDVILYFINDGAGKYGLADADGRIVIPPIWDKIDSWRPIYGGYNYIIVLRNGKCGLLANDGTELIPPVLDKIRKNDVFLDSLENWQYMIGKCSAWIVKDGKEGIYSLAEKKMLIPPIYDKVKCSLHIEEGFEAKIGAKDVYYDVKGKVLYPLNDDLVMVGCPGRLALVKRNGKYGFINRDGVIVEPVVHKEADYNVDHEEVTIDGVKGKVTHEGKILFHTRTWIDEQGTIYEPDVESESGIYIYTTPRILKIPLGIIIHLDDITYVERVEGEPGLVSHRKLFPDGKYECQDEVIPIGSTQHDYYEYMDHDENELHIEGESFGDIVEGKDAEFLWDWFWQNFQAEFIEKNTKLKS